jgi:hypothetical protein
MIIEKSHQKLTPDQVREIRANYVRNRRGSGNTLKDMAIRHGVSEVTMHRVVTGQIYKDVRA